MAKLIVAVTVLFFVLALTHARTPLDLPRNDVTSQDLPTNVEESDPKTTATLLLPSEKPESESATAVDVEPQKTESGKAEVETNEFVPLTVINFRPISRQFPRRPSLTLRHRRPCRLHRFGKPWGPTQFHHREMAYGNDMVMSSGDGKEVRQIPAKWVKFHHADTNGPRFPNWRDDGVAEIEEFKRPHHFHHHHHHHHHHDHHDEEGEGHEHEYGFLTKIRKFLNRF